MTINERRLASRAAFLAGALAAGLTLVYLGWIGGQGTGLGSRVVFVAGWLITAAALFLIAAFVNAPRRRALLAGVAACMLLPLAFAAMFSIGLLVLVIALIGGGAASVAAYEGGVGTWQRVAAALLLVIGGTALLILGFSLTT